MFRVLFCGFVVFAFLGEGDFNKNSVIKATEISYYSSENIDPIIVGHLISDAHKRRWEINSNKYHECGMCGEEAQAYPGD